VSRPRSNLFLWLLAGVLALIVYGSLYPFDFQPDAIEGGLLEALRQLSWQRAGRSDRIFNVLLYLPLGFCLFLGLATRLRRRVAGVLAVLAGASLSLAIEVAQVYLTIRVPSLTDLTLNALGTALGAAGGAAWRALGGLIHVPMRDDMPLSRDPCARIVLVLWFAWRFAPFVPHLDLAKLKSATRPLVNPTFDATAVFTYLTCWLVVNQAIASLIVRARQFEALLLIIAVVLVGRLLVAEQVFIPSELLALLLLLPMVVLMHRLTAAVQRTVLIATVATLLLLEWLAPFNFTANASHLHLWPLPSWPQDDLLTALRSVDWVDLLGKLFWFAALLWLLKEARVPIHRAIGIVTISVLILELLQLWLPTRVSSIGDPLLALGVGLVFRWMGAPTRNTRSTKILEKGT
jgi:glycopeptide antibiotics resistance protein